MVNFNEYEELKKIRGFYRDFSAVKKVLEHAIQFRKQPFTDWKMFWEYTKDCKSQEEYEKAHTKSIKKGILVLRRLIKEKW